MTISEETKRIIAAHGHWVEKTTQAIFSRESTQEERRVVGRTPFEAGWEAAKKDSELSERGKL